MKSISMAVACAAVLGLSACATQKEVNLDQKALTGIHRIAVVGPADPIPVTVLTESEVRAQKAVQAAAAIPFAGVLGAAIAGGVAGGIAAEIARETTEPLAKKVEEENYKLGDAMQVSLVDALKHDGYDVSAVTFTRAKPGKLPDNYDAIKDQADLVVDGSASAICSNVDSGKTSHFRPVVTMDVRLFRTSDRTVVMERHFLLDDAVAMEDGYHVKGGTQFDLADYDALKADVGKCLDGVKAAVPVLSQSVAAALAPSSQTASAAPLQ